MALAMAKEAKSSKWEDLVQRDDCQDQNELRRHGRS